MKKRLAAARAAVATALARMEAADQAITDAGDDADLDALRAEFDASLADHAAAVAEYDRVKTVADARAALPADAGGDDGGTVRVGDEPLTYAKGNGQSIFRDMLRVEKTGDPQAAARLARHMDEMRVEQPEKFDLSSTDAAGGQLIAPVFLQDMFVDLARAGRTVANVIGSHDLPPNTDSINLPTLATGVTVATQADNAAVSETDATFGTLAADVKTIAGMQDMSQQLFDRSVPGVDEVVFVDLVKAYNGALDSKVITNATANNLGLLDVSGINAVTYTDASPTLGELYPKIADGVQQIATGIFMPAQAIFMHPRRWAFCLSQVDSTGRPLVSPYAPQNAAGTFGGQVAEGPVGSIQGLPVYVDPNIPTNLGAGTNEDRIIIVRTDELLLWEDASGPYLETFRDVGSGTLTVRVRLHNYWAQLHARRPKAISVISGTGLVTPTF